MMEIESFSFYESLKFLGDRAGIVLPDTGMQKNISHSEENQSVLEAYEWLTKLYHHLLRFTKDGKEGYSYFKDRQINDESIEAYQLGFAPNAIDFIVKFLEKKGFNKQLLIKAGLVSLQEDNRVTDRFRGRVIFPIRNHLGKTVAFGARSIDDQGPKYLNSSESELFQKSKLLYNFDLAKRHIRKESEAILFEGYMDVISAYQSGVKNVVATMGTALTEPQAKLLKRYVSNVILCYDGDAAGQEASYKAANVLKEAGCQVKIAYLKEGIDPDSFIRENGGEAFKNQIIRASDTYMTFYMRYIKKNYNMSLEAEKLNYIQIVLKELAGVESSIEREYYLQELSKEFEMSLDALKEEMQIIEEKHGISKHKSEKNSYTKNASNHTKKRKLLPAFQNAERSIIYYMLQDDWVATKVQQEIGAGFKVDEHKIIVTHLYAFYEEGNISNVSKFVQNLEDDNLKQLVTEIAMIPALEEINDNALNDYIRIIGEQSSDKVTIKLLKDKLKVAEQQNDPLKAAQFGQQILEIQKKLKNHN